MNKKEAGDTLVYLNKSKLKFKLKTEFTKEQIALIDEYFATHKIPTVSDTIIGPMRELCGTHDSYGYAWENSYRPYPGKYLGIALSQDVVTYSNAKWKYGFSKIFVGGDYDINLAFSAGFSYDNMMFGISNPQQQINTIFGSYHIDEPFEKHNDVWDDYTILQKAATVYPKKVFLSSYKWPSWSYSLPVTYGAKYGSVINSGTNIFIMCDEYHGNCWAKILGQLHTVVDYWNEFHGYYGSSKNISNWLSVSANSGDGPTHVDCGNYSWVSSSWWELLLDANRNNLDELWLWANGTGDEMRVGEFCYNAWGFGWLLRAYGYYCIVCGCDSVPCYPDCQWGVGNGDGGYIKQIYKLGDDVYLPASFQ